MDKTYTYFMTQRPPMPGAMPKNGLCDIHEYDGRDYISEIGRKAYARLEYSRKLSDQEVKDYELVPLTYYVELTRAEISYLRTMLFDRIPIALDLDDDTELLERLYKKFEE